jgi:tetratricopeptide (TPR) repeat protein
MHRAKQHPTAGASGLPLLNRLGHLTAMLVVLLLSAPYVCAQSSRTAPRQAAESAQKPVEPPPEALEHYKRGRQWYLAGRYRDALVELKAALLFDQGAPDLIYNIARVYENLGELDEAIVYYRRYQERLPRAAIEEREHTATTIRRLQGAKRETGPRIAQEPPQSSGVGRADSIFWLTAGGALALLGGGGVSGVLALERRAKVASFIVGVDGSLTRRNTLSDQTERLALLADGLFIAGGVAMTAAALLFFLRAPDPDPQPSIGMRLDLHVDSRRAWLGLAGHF